MKNIDFVEYSEKSPSYLFWKIGVSKYKKLGEVCGHLNSDSGYWETRINTVLYRNHVFITQVYIEIK